MVEKRAPTAQETIVGRTTTTGADVRAQMHTTASDATADLTESVPTPLTLPAVLVVIATFERPGGAAAFGRALRERFGVSDKAIGEARAGAYGEPYDGHQLVAAWVPRQLSEDVRVCATRHEGTLHEPPASVRPPAWIA